MYGMVMWDGQPSNHTFWLLSWCFSMFGYNERMPDETDAKKILTASASEIWRRPLDALILCEWRLSSKTWNPITPPRMNQLTWLRIVHSGDWCLHLVQRTPVAHARDVCSASPIILVLSELICIPKYQEVSGEGGGWPLT